MSFGGTEVGSIKATVGLDTSDLKRGLDQAKQALSESARMTQDALRFTNDLAKGIDREADAARRANLVKQQSAALDRELSAAKVRLSEALAGEDRLVQNISARYNLLSNSRRAELVEVKQQIAAQEQLAAAATKAAAAQAAAQRNLGRNLQTIGGGLTNAVTTPIVGAALAAGYAGQQVQNAEAGIRAGTGLTGGALQSVEESFKKIAPEVSQPLKQVGDAVAELERRTGLTGVALEKLSIAELNLQRITGSGNELFKDSAQVFAAWNVPVAKQVPLLDEVNRAHQQTGISVTKLLESVSKSAPTFQLMGKSVEDSIATFAAFNKVNIAPERLITALNTAMGKLAKAGVPDVGKAMADMLQRIQNLKDPTEALSEAVRLFGARGGTQLAAALRSGKLSLDDLLNSIKNGADTIEKTDKDTQTFNTTWGKMRNAFLIALAPLGEVVLKFTQLAMQALKPAIEWLGKLLEAFGKLDPGTQKFILGAVAVAAAIGPVIGGVGKLITAFNVLKGAWGAISLAFTAAAEGGGALELVGGAIAALSGPIGIAILAIGALAAAWELNLGHIQEKTHDAMAATTESLNRLAPRVAANQSLPTFVGTGDPAADMAAMASMDSMRQAEEQRKMAAGPTVTAKGLAASGFASHMGTGGATWIPPQVSGPTTPLTVPGLTGAEHQALFGKDKKPKLSEAEKEDQRAVEQMLKDQRELAFLQRGESVDVARLAGEYPHLSAARLEEIVASRKQLDAAVKATESRKAYGKDLEKLNDEIRRLKAGHDAEAGGLDALKEKYPGLTRVQLQHIFSVEQYEKSLNKLHETQKKVNERLAQAGQAFMTQTAATRAGKIALELFKEEADTFAKKFPGATAGQFWNQLQPNQQRRAKDLAFQGASGDLIEQSNALDQANAALYTGQRAQRYSQTVFGRDLGNLPSGTATDINRMFAKQDINQQREAGFQAFNAPIGQRNELIGTIGPQTQRLAEQFQALTGKSAAARDTMAKFGVVLKELPKDTQASVRGFLEMSKSLEFIQNFASGVQGVFQGMFDHLYQHGFKGLFASVTQGFSQMLQKMAADYLSSQLGNLFMRLLGPVLGSTFGGGGGISDMSQIVGHAAGGNYQAGRPFWAGERGPELIFPTSGGTVVPHGQSMAMAGTTNITLHVHGVSDAQSFQAPQNQHAIMTNLARSLDRAQQRRR